MTRSALQLSKLVFTLLARDRFFRWLPAHRAAGVLRRRVDRHRDADPLRDVVQCDRHLISQDALDGEIPCELQNDFFYEPGNFS